MNGDSKGRLRDRLAIYSGGTSARATLWFDESRESTFGALTGSAVEDVVGKFREELEKAEKKRN